MKGTAGVEQPGVGSDWISLQMTSGVPKPLCTSVSSPLKWDGEFPGGPVIRTVTFISPGSIPGQGTKILQAVGLGQNKLFLKINKVNWDGNIPIS